MEKELKSALEGNLQEKKWKIDGFFFFSFQLSHLEEVHASILWVLENFTFSLLSSFGILMWTGMDWCV